MAEFHFLHGSFKGRLGDVVFSSWRGKDYAKVYPPANPHTIKQEAHREVWGALGHVAHGIYAQILKPYTYPKPQKHTAYNHLLMLNNEMLHNNVYAADKLKILDGGLTRSPITAATWSSTSKKITITWSNTLIGSMKETDKAIIVAIQNKVVVGFIIALRSAGTADIDAAVFQKLKNGATDIYLAFAQEPTPGTTEQGMNSITAYKAVSVTGLLDINLPPSSAPAQGEPSS